MEARGARMAGLIGGAIVMAGGLFVALRPGEQAPTPAVTQPAPAPVETVQPVLTPSPPASAPAAEIAAADAPPKPAPKTASPAQKSPTKAPLPTPTQTKEASPDNPNLEFIVRVREGHPLHRAQSLQEQGKRAEAEVEARYVLARNAELRGFCFEGFTLGAEIVLVACDAVAAAQSKRTSAQMARRLKAMRNTAYAEENIIVRQDETRVR
jgi:hypothetical protein